MTTRLARLALSERPEIVDSPAAFARLQPEWERLVASTGISHPFATHAWMRAWWDAFGSGARLRVIVLRRNGAVAGIAPFLARERTWHGLRIRSLELMRNDHTPRTDLVIAPSDFDTLGRLWGHLRATREDWDVLLLPQVPASSPSLGLLESWARADGFRTGIWRPSPSPYLTCGAGWARYDASLSANRRASLRRRQKRLERHGSVALETIRGGAPLREALDDAFRIEASGWKGRSGTAIASREATRRFYVTLAREAAERGWLSLHFLTVGGLRVAFQYNLEYGERGFLLKLGFDPAFSSGAPGRILTWRVLERAFRNGMREFDFLGDDVRWKREWTNASRAHAWLYVFGDTARARCVHAAKFRIGPWLHRISARARTWTR